MPERVRKRSKKAGLPPGTLMHIGERRTEKVKITLIDYDETQFQEKEVERVEDCFPFKDTPTVTWINIDGLHDVAIIEKIGKQFGFHPLLLEDILNTNQRPKMEDFEHYIYIVLKMLYYGERAHEVTAEQISLILGSHFVISFQEREDDVFTTIRERIRNAKGRIRKAGADYLAYTLIDAIVDTYFLILEHIEEKIEDIEEELVTNPTPETLQRIHRLKRELILLSKSVWPLREVIGGLQRAESPLIQATTSIYLRDVHDHTIQVIESIETFREMISGMVDIYLSSISNKMNEVIKVLTIIATIFIPLTFIAGIYGMNFEYMPELEWRWGYPFVWLVIGAVVISMLLYFKRKKWL
ncbi:MAG: magnesium/cobalt transporter CorA [Methanophagales archaeon ANME-1-THS]|nr:MAG: magnesium/cobalt transporter CorA [Methanophagales archaeon ANME-1-THS]